MSGARTILVFPDRAALSHAAAERFVSLAQGAIGERGRFTVALSGGSTPRDLYRDLALPEYRPRVDWTRCFFFWGDERCVPPDDPQSNFLMAHQALLSRVPVPLGNIYRIPGEESPEHAAEKYEQTLRNFDGANGLAFDLVLLGLGANGHTASLFPHTAAVDERTRWCVAVWVPELNTFRITLTAPLLNEGRQIDFLVAGADKAEVLAAVVRGPYDPRRLPAQIIRPQSGDLVWLLDQAAAAQLGPQAGTS